MPLPTPHGDKLRALLANEKLPPAEHGRVREAIAAYEGWLTRLSETEGAGEALVVDLVGQLTEYKRSIDLKLIFDSPEDFLYRQKGQLKLDNTVLEEFLPWLVTKCLEERIDGLDVWLGPSNCFSGIRFESGLLAPAHGAGLKIRSKDQDFAIARKIYLRSSHRADFSHSLETESSIAYLAAEIKTNLDKTMFQEAAATAIDVKAAVPGARYLLLCEWLDMTPINSTATSIDEVIILRKSKRLPANIRSRFASAEGRTGAREAFVEYLDANPFAADSFLRILGHAEELLGNPDIDVDEVLDRGWF